MIVVVVVKEAATTEADAMMPLIKEDDAVDFACCILITKKSIKSFGATISIQKKSSIYLTIAC
jgi:hypothetical protein